MENTKFILNDNREYDTDFERIPYGSWFTCEDGLYIKVKPYKLHNDGDGTIYNAMDFYGVGYVFDDTEQATLVQKLSITILE